MEMGLRLSEAGGPISSHFTLPGGKSLGGGGCSSCWAALSRLIYLGGHADTRTQSEVGHGFHLTQVPRAAIDYATVRTAPLGVGDHLGPARECPKPGARDHT